MSETEPGKGREGRGGSVLLLTTGQAFSVSREEKTSQSLGFFDKSHCAVLCCTTADGAVSKQQHQPCSQPSTNQKEMGRGSSVKGGGGLPMGLALHCPASTPLPLLAATSPVPLQSPHRVTAPPQSTFPRGEQHHCKQQTLSPGRAVGAFLAPQQ